MFVPEQVIYSIIAKLWVQYLPTLFPKIQTGTHLFVRLFRLVQYIIQDENTSLIGSKILVIRGNYSR